MVHPSNRNSPGTVGTEEQLRLQLQGLQHQVARGAARVRRLIKLAIILGVLFAVLLISIYLYHVFQFARLSGEPTVSPLREAPGTVQIEYIPLSTGKVEFVRRAADQIETLTEYPVPDDPSSKDGKKTFTWQGKEETKYSLTIRYRSGLFVKEKKWSPPAK